MARLRYVIENRNIEGIEDLGAKKALKKAKKASKKVGKAVKQITKTVAPIVAPVALPSVTISKKFFKKSKPFSIKTSKLKNIVKQEAKKFKEKLANSVAKGKIEEAKQIQEQIQEINKVEQELTNMEKAGTAIVSASKHEEIINRVPSIQDNINIRPKTTAVVYKLSSGKWVYKSDLQPNLYIEIPSDLVVEETTPQDFVEKQVPMYLAEIYYGVDVLYDRLGGLNFDGIDTEGTARSGVVKILATIVGTGTADLEQIKAIETRKLREIRQRTILKYLPIGLVGGGLIVYLLLSKKSSTPKQ